MTVSWQPNDPPRACKPSQLDPTIPPHKRNERIWDLETYAITRGYRSTDPNLPRLLMKEAMLVWGVQSRTAEGYVEIVLMKMRRAGL